MNTKDIEEMTVEELNLDYVKKDIWEAMPYTAGFIERNTKTKADADCILRKIAEHHRQVIDTLTQHHEAEVRREKQELINQLLKSLPLRSDWDDDEKVTFEKVVCAMRETLESYDFTPTKTDKQTRV